MDDNGEKSIINIPKNLNNSVNSFEHCVGIDLLDFGRVEVLIVESRG